MMRTIGLVVAIVVVIGVIMYALVRPTVGWPDESRRVSHPAGFSIVQPEGWERHLTFSSGGYGTDLIRFLPAKAVGSPGFFTVTRIATPVTEADRTAKGYKPITFAGQPAWERWTAQSLTHEQTRSMIFERSGQWFDISLRRPDIEPLDVGVWRAYAETFRVEPVKTLSTTLPATLPATLP